MQLFIRVSEVKYRGYGSWARWYVDVHGEVCRHSASVTFGIILVNSVGAQAELLINDQGYIMTPGALRTAYVEMSPE